jgi:lysophospholipase L1-like esterase
MKLPIHFLALGDSYTIGESVPVAERWPVQLADRLRQAEQPVEAPHIVATTGWTTAELQAGIAQSQDTLRETYDLVSLLIGVNNQYRGYDTAIYVAEYEALLQQAVAFAGGKPERVFAVSIPDYGVTPFASGKDAEKIARELDWYNAAAQGICQRYGVIFLNITPISRRAASDPALIADDGLHPSGAMYKAWVDEVLAGPVSELLP